MAVDDPWAIDGLSLSALEWRRALSGLLAHDTDLVSARPGVLSGCGVTVAGLTATVAAGQMVVTPSIGSNGSYLVGLTATALAITAQDATYARIDRVIARIYDNSVDGSGQTKAAVEIVTGTPSAAPALPAMPAGALELAQLQVPKAGTGITVVDKRPFTVANGGVPHFDTTTARDAAITAPAAGKMCTTGTGAGLTVWVYTGTAWKQVDYDLGWQDYTPTITGVTIGNGTVTARYWQRGKTVVAEALITLGSTSAVTGAVTITLPVTAARSQNVGSGVCRPGGSGTVYQLTPYAAASSSLVAVGVVGASGALSSVGSASPAAWAATGWMKCQFTYEAA